MHPELLCHESSSNHECIEILNLTQYKIVFTADQEMKAYIEKAQSLTSHNHPQGDLDTIFKAALKDYVEKLEKRKFGTKVTNVAKKTKKGKVVLQQKQEYEQERKHEQICESKQNNKCETKSGTRSSTSCKHE